MCLKTRLEEISRDAQQSLDDGNGATRKKTSKPATTKRKPATSKRKRAPSEETSQDEASKPSTSKRIFERVDEETSDAEASQEEEEQF